MSLNKKSVNDFNAKGKRVLVRCDFNVPLKEGVITDETRIKAALPTIKKLINDGGKVILCSHLGKPKGEPKPELSLAPVAKRLSEMLGKEVVFAMDEKNTDGEKYMTCFVERDELFERYNECLLSDDYAEIAKIFAERIKNEAELVIEEISIIEVDTTPIYADGCTVIKAEDSIKNKVVVIRADVFKPEYQIATMQLQLLTDI
mgnify:CR=1 FL=1